MTWLGDHEPGRKRVQSQRRPERMWIELWEVAKHVDLILAYFHS